MAGEHSAEQDSPIRFLESIRADLRNLCGYLREKERANAILRCTIADLEGKVERLGQEADRLDGQVIELSDANDRIEDEKVALEKQLEAANQRIAELEEANEQLEESNRELQRDYEQARGEMINYQR